MTAPLSSRRPGRTEFSHGTSRAPHPDSDFQSQRNLPWQISDRNQGSKRGGFTAQMRREAEFRSDPTRADEDIESLLYVRGNPDMYGPDQLIVQEKPHRASGRYKQPQYRTSVDRQE